MDPQGRPSIVLGGRMRACVSLWIDINYRCVQWNVEYYDPDGERLGCVVHCNHPAPSTAGEALEEALDRLSSLEEQLTLGV